MIEARFNKTGDLPEEHKDTPFEELIQAGLIKPIKEECELHGTYLARPIAKFGVLVIYSRCPSCEKEREEAKRLEAEKALQEKRKREYAEFVEILKLRGCGMDYIKKRSSLKFDTELLNQKISDEHCLVDFLRIENNDFLINKNLILLGACGIGKTFFACKMVEEALKIKKKYVLLASFELVSIYANGNREDSFSKFNSADNVFNFLEDVDCVILDEIDYCFRSQRNAKEKEALDIFSHYVSKNDIRVIVMGNCTATELIDNLDHKVFSRLAKGKVIEGWNIDDMRAQE